jgi:hypothetical protein
MFILLIKIMYETTVEIIEASAKALIDKGIDDISEQLKQNKFYF